MRKVIATPYSLTSFLPRFSSIKTGIVTLRLATLLTACGGAVATQTGTVRPATATATFAPSPPLATATVSATATRPPSPTVAPTAAIAPTQTRAITPTATTRPASSLPPAPQGGGVVVDENGVCRATLPAGYTLDSDGDGFDADAEKGFGVLAWAAGRGESAEALARSAFTSFVSSFTGVQQGKATTSANASRMDFTGMLGSRAGQGSVYVKKFDQKACAFPVFTYQGAQVPHETVITALIGALREK